MILTTILFPPVFSSVSVGAQRAVGVGVGVCVSTHGQGGANDYFFPP